MFNLPEEFKASMQKLLGNEYEAYMMSFENPRHYGLRVNTAKISPEVFEEIVPFQVKRIPFIPNGYYYDGVTEPAKHPYYYAGLYYLQEPSAMTPAALLLIEEGDRVLDLCAAPGGKATELGARLRGKGILVANDISASRARGLLKNIELQGIANCYVTAETPEKLAEYYPEAFDKILVDAPCSGEGMFRKEPALIKSWLERGPATYHAIQKEIMASAIRMLRPGGLLLYSTCTFSYEEDEATIEDVLKQYPEMKLMDLSKEHGFREELQPYEQCVRIYPHLVDGEGHFLALLQKEEGMTEETAVRGNKPLIPESILKPVREWMQYTYSDVLKASMKKEALLYRDDNLYLLPDGIPCHQSLRYLRTGLHLGTVDRNGRFEPSQALAMHLKCSEYAFCLNLKADDTNVIKYLKGETIALPAGFRVENKASVLVCVDGYPLGWGKVNQQMLKNKYAVGWLYQGRALVAKQ